jgi:hypothetical protein
MIVWLTIDWIETSYIVPAGHFAWKQQSANTKFSFLPVPTFRVGMPSSNLKKGVRHLCAQHSSGRSDKGA